jgi:hypothetical protein
VTSVTPVFRSWAVDCVVLPHPTRTQEPKPVLRPPHPRCHPQPRLAGAAYSAARQEAGASAHRQAREDVACFPSSPPGPRCRRPQLPHSAAPGRNRPDRSADVLCFIEVKTRTSRNVKTPKAVVDRHKRREAAAVAQELPAPPATVVPMEVRHCERILFAGVGQPAANRSISQCLPLGVEYRFCNRERIQ